ncbi:MAG: hypothetical protein ACRD0P_06400 [Stackebrandtia sp.]
MKPPSHRYSWHIARDIFACFAKWVVGVWLLLVAVIGAIIAGIAMFSQPEVSIFAFTLNPAPYWILVFGAILPATMLRHYVANGVTRRDFVWGAGLASVGLSGLAAVLGTVALVAEGRLYASAGWSHVSENPHLFTSTDQIGLVFVELLLIFGSHMFAGWAAGAMFYRFGAWATPGAVLAYCVAASIDVLLGAGWAGRVVLDNVYKFTPSWMLAAGVGLVAMAALFLLSKQLLRQVPVPAKSS